MKFLWWTEICDYQLTIRLRWWSESSYGSRVKGIFYHCRTVRIMLISREFVNEFLMKFFQRTVCLTSNKPFHFDADPDSGTFNGIVRIFQYQLEVCSVRLLLISVYYTMPVRKMSTFWRCSSKCNVSSTVSTPLYLLLNPTLIPFVQEDIPMSFQNVVFSSAKTRALSGVYTDTYDDGAVLQLFFTCAP